MVANKVAIEWSTLFQRFPSFYFYLRRLLLVFVGFVGDHDVFYDR